VSGEDANAVVSAAMPTFVGLGAQRAGTTWLYNCLASHPEIFMSRKKELYFFSRNYERGLDWYREQFAEGAAAVARGEITPDYMYREDALRRLAADLPDVKALVMLRNPVDRAISAYALHPERYEGMTFRQAAEQVESLLDRGFYTRHLATIYRHVARDKVLLLFYDDIAAAPGRLLDQTFEFLGVRTGFRPPGISQRVNRVIYPGLQKFLRGSGLEWTVDVVKKTPLGGWIRRRHSTPRRETSVVSGDDLAWMRGKFAEEIVALSDLTGRDLRAWQS
jgi:hypothetical protein